MKQGLWYFASCFLFLDLELVDMHNGSKLAISGLLFRRRFLQSRIPTSSSASAVPVLRQRNSDLATLVKPYFPCEFVSKLHYFRVPNSSVPLPRFVNGGMRCCSGPGRSVAEFDRDREVDMINLKFADAREEIEMALESKETVYFDEEAECARAAVKEVVGMFEGLLAKLPEAERAALQRSMGLKIEQLKAEIQQLDE